jgi:hypothetical protein
MKQCNGVSMREDRGGRWGTDAVRVRRCHNGLSTAVTVQSVLQSAVAQMVRSSRAMKKSR